MDSAFAWIGQLAEWFGQFVPRREIVETTHAAVKFVGGDRVVKLGPGFHWYWPFRSTFHTYPTARQAVDLRSQTLITKDAKTIVVGGLVVYDIKDIEAILAKTWDPEQTIKDISLTALHDTLAKMTWVDIRHEAELGVLNKLLRESVRRELDRYGVRVLKVALTDLAPTRVYRVIQSTSQDGV